MAASFTATASAPRSSATVDPFRTRESDHVFFSTMALASALTIAGGFLSTYGAKIAASTPVPPIIHLHAAIFTAWIALFVTQTLLVKQGRVATHKRLGTASIALAAVLIVLGIATAVSVTRAGHRGIPGVEFPTPAGFLLLNVNATLIFAVLFAAAWSYRHNSQAHKRLMLTAITGSMLGPGGSRLPFVAGKPPLIAVLVLSFLFAGPIYDLITRRQIHRAYWLAIPVSFLGIPPVVEGLASTSLWQAVSGWILG